MEDLVTHEKTEPPFAKRVGQGAVHLRLLNLTDLHMEIRAYDYFADRPTEGGGLARAASFIDCLRSKVKNSLLFENGDFLQGNPMGDYSAEQPDVDPHPMIAALNELRPDAATIGNHEFNYGLEFLNKTLAAARFPVVSANVITRRGASPTEDETFVPPYVILRRTVQDGAGQEQVLAIGVIGLLPPQIVQWDRKHLAGKIYTRDIVEAARSYVPEIREKGADLIVALSHSGIDGAKDRPGLENASLPLAALDGVDAVITGHSHLVFPSARFTGMEGVDLDRGCLHGKPATMAGFGGSHVGVIDLLLHKTGKTWEVAETQVFTPAVPSTGVAAGTVECAILEATQAAHEGTLDYTRRPIGHTEQPLDSYFAMLEPASSVRFVATAQCRYVRHLLRGTPYADLPLLSAAAPFKMGGLGGPENYSDVPAGAVAMRNVADLYGYPNVLRAILVDGAALRNWLEHSAGLYRQIKPGVPDQPLIDPAFPSHNFDTITGLTYEIDLSQPARFSATGVLIHPDAHRIRKLEWQGRPVAESQRFVVATNDYRASRSGTFPGADDGELILTVPDTHRDVLIRYLQETPPDREIAAPPWTFAACDGASIVVRTGQGALANTQRWEELGLENLGTDAKGSVVFRKRL